MMPLEPVADETPPVIRTRANTVLMKTKPGAAGADGSRLGSMVEGTSRPTQPEHRLRAGDIVYFGLVEDADEKCGVDNGLLTGEGLSDNRVGMYKVGEEDVPVDPPNFRQCLFRVVPKLVYDAQKQLSKLKAASAEKKKESLLGSERLAAQGERANTERMRNAASVNYVRTNQGKYITYGETIQLQHIHSDRFLSLCPRTLADEEKDSLKLVIADDSEDSYFSFMPRFKSRTEGSWVYLTDQVCIKHVQLGDHIVHGGNSAFSSDNENRVEANLKQVADLSTARNCSWRINQYEHLEKGQHKFLRFGHVFRLFHPDANAFVASTCNRASSKLPYLLKTQKAALHEDNNRPKTAFAIEGVSRRQGGLVPWESLVRFRHIASGKYLSADPRDSHMPKFWNEQRFVDNPWDLDASGVPKPTALQEGIAGVLLGCKLVAPSPDDRSTHFCIHPTIQENEDGEQLFDVSNSVVQIRLEHRVNLESVYDPAFTKKNAEEALDATEDAMDSFWLTNTMVGKERVEDSSNAKLEGGTVNCKIAFGQKQQDQDVFMMIPVSYHDVVISSQVMGIGTVIDNYVDILKASKSAGGSQPVTEAQIEPVVSGDRALCVAVQQFSNHLFCPGACIADGHDRVVYGKRVGD
jgi:hypothetical protein